MDRVKKQIDQRYHDFVEFVNADLSQSNQKFREKLLEELQEANQELEQEIGKDVKRDKSECPSSGLLKVDPTRRHSPEKKHLESQLQEVLDELNNPSSSMTIKDLKIRLNLENKRLQVFLREEFEARNKAKQQRFKGTQPLKEFQNLITNGLDCRYNKLESNQINLLNQNRLNTQEKREMLVELQEAQIERASSSNLESALASWKQDRVEAAETARLKAEKIEVVEDRELAEKRAREADQRVRDLEAYLEDEGGDFTKAQQETNWTISELNKLMSQYNKAMNKRDYIAELEMERERTMRVREEACQLRTKRDEIKIRSDERMFPEGNSVKKRKVWKQMVATQAEKSSQIVNLMSQVRDLRAARDEAEAHQADLVTAKRSLEQRLKEIRSGFLLANSGQLTNDRFLKTLQQEQSELKRQLEEKEDHFLMELEKKIKSLNLKIVDLETRLMATPPPRLISSQNQKVDQKQYKELLNQIKLEKQNLIKETRKSKRILKDLQIKLLDSERSRGRLKDKVSNFENKLLSLRNQNSDLVIKMMKECNKIRPVKLKAK
ncbi:hypothetical protein BY996DRAFT_6527317 [Phakopsora pachyrhizi]|nr:hypothetical protein BY996DRAFT_6527317 [Phakopsora pachyrhizi]